MARTGRPRLGDKRLNVMLPRDLIVDLHEIALVEGISLAALCRRALVREVKRARREGRRVA